MNTRKYSPAAVLLIIPLFFLFLIASCDSDNNMLVPDSEAQEPVPNVEEEAAMGCPCFTAEEVETAGNNSNTVECGVAVFGMALLPDSSPTSALTVDCLTDGTMCQCSNAAVCTHRCAHRPPWLNEPTTMRKHAPAMTSSGMTIEAVPMASNTLLMKKE